MHRSSNVAIVKDAHNSIVARVDDEKDLVNRITPISAVDIPVSPPNCKDVFEMRIALYRCYAGFERSIRSGRSCGTLPKVP